MRVFSRTRETPRHTAGSPRPKRKRRQIRSSYRSIRTIAVTIGIREASLRRHYGKVTAAAQLLNAWTVQEEQDITIYICEGPSMPIQQLWPSLAGQE
jgi:hypothetical protein